MAEAPSPNESKIIQRDWVSIRRPTERVGLETMKATYVKQFFKPHAHDEYVLGVIEGGVHSVWCRGIHYNIPSAHVVTMHPGDVHSGGAGIDAGWRQRMIYISEAEMRDIVRDIMDTDQDLLPEFAQSFHAIPDLAAAFGHFHEVLHGSPLTLARDVALNALMRSLLGILSPKMVPDLSPAPEGRIGDAVEYLRARAEDDVSLDELCDVSGLRRRQTIDAFKRKTGLPPHAYHLIQKVKAVKSMLQIGVSVAEAAMHAGFADQSHMTRHFVAIVGMTPSAYAHATR